MKLQSFTLKNYRSITEKSIIIFNDFTVLLGKNNVGKSNVLNGLECAMNILKNSKRYALKRNKTSLTSREYDIERDYPINISNKQGRRPTFFALTFKLSAREKKRVEKIIKKDIDSLIEIVITIKSNGTISIEVNDNLQYSTEDISNVCNYISNNFTFRYIPAVRTEDTSKEVLNSIIRDQLIEIKASKEYKDAINIVNDIQKEELKKLSKRLIEPLKVFIGNIKDINITTKEENRVIPYYRGIEINIDDGVLTDIAYKGDGIKNLIALAILNNSKNTNEIVAIEEPESHLHPEAMRNLFSVINEISKNKQVIVTTHNPLFVKRNNLSANYIVDNKKVFKADSIKVIKKILGVVSSDNLENADKVLLVEGETDKKYLEKLLSIKSKKIKKALENNILIIDPLYGASKLSSEISRMNNNLCTFLVLLDKDDSGTDSYNKALNNKLIDEKQVFFTVIKGQKYSEFEDCLKPESYCEIIYKHYGVNINTKDFRKSKEKWSDRIKKEFLNNGKLFDDEKIKEIKCIVCNEVNEKIDIKNYKDYYFFTKSEFLNSLISEIEKIL